MRKYNENDVNNWKTTVYLTKSITFIAMLKGVLQDKVKNNKTKVY